ncbi:MAG TPA: riboflavin biosynthesis protein RibF, partial [Anaerolineaceae bacterium]|nr:riboflavin biosynthesis protein RibF [Anaerolineaceae bacterium]
GARQAKCQSVAITFDPLPALFFKRITTDHILTSIDERVALIKNLGVDQVVVLDFTREFADIDALTFMTEVKKALGLQKLFAGYNFTLGKDQAGTVAVLKEIGQQLDFEVEVVPPIRHGQEIISSSNIRKILKTGDVAKAAEYLGRPYALSGLVVHGENRGSKLGIPTANLAIPGERLLPAMGVYATRAHINGKTYLSVTNVGVRPTFENPLPSPRVEPHLLDTSETFYGKNLTLEFVEYIRPEVRFPDSKALVAQIQLDILKTREILK